MADVDAQVKKVTQEQFAGLLQSDLPVLVDFYADWCPPCRQLAPVLEQFAGNAADVQVVKVNVDEQPLLAQQYGVSSIPTLVVLKQGEVANRHVGFANEQQLQQLVN